MDDENPERDVFAAFWRHQASMDRLAWRLLGSVATVLLAIVLHRLGVF